MFRRILVGVAAVCATISFASTGNAEEGPPPSGCVGLRYGVLFGEGIAVSCPAGPSPAMYRVIAYCATGTAQWHQFGTWVQPGFGPSAAACQGGLLASARVVGYAVETQG